MAGQLQTGEYVSSTTGKKLTLGEGYKPISHLDILGRQVRSKLSPAASFAARMLEGQGPGGEKLKISKEVADRFTPMVIQDIAELAKDDPSLLPIEALGMFGMGIQTYKGKPPKSKLGIKPIGGLGIKGLQ